MTTLVYAKLPFSQIHYIERPEFHNVEKVFKSRLLESLKKHGIVDPLYAEVGNDYGKYIKIIVGNNRMAAAKILGIKIIPVIVNIYDPTFKLEGTQCRELKTDDEIRELFTHKNVNIRRGSDGNIDTIMPPRYELVYKDYELQKK
tara:strand:+ start:42 stop:476 length:435 start_codon:yes stop_codon:yes gene_type:complete